MITLKINNISVEVEANSTILQAARQAGIHIPTLCYLKDVTETGACRVCCVEIKGARALGAACNYPVVEGMEVYTHSKKALAARRNTIKLILSNHARDCLSCIRNQNCELQQLTRELGIRDVEFPGTMTKKTFDDAAEGIVRDTSKCVLCGRCVTVCQKEQGLGILGIMERGFNTKVGPLFDKSFNDVNCMECGQCVNVCPVGALSEKEELHQVIEVLNDTNKHVIVQTAPAVRAALGEEFGMPIGTRVTGKMVAALRKIGFDKVYDTNFGSDVTILEEGHELINRIKSGGALPMITSCSPGWIRYAEFEYPELLAHISSCKSPQIMLGALAKSYYAKTKGISPNDIYVVSIMPCLAKKAEKARPELQNKDGIRDVDAVLTTRELGTLIKMYGLDFDALADEEYDQDILGEYSGAGVILGVTGGVMEAAVRTVYKMLSGAELDDIELKAVRGVEGLKEANVMINDVEIKLAVAHSMAIAKPLLEDIRQGISPYHFIEIMGCPGGCINGGGQPIVDIDVRNGIKALDWKRKRAVALYDEDLLMPKRRSHENEQVKALYDDFLGEPGSPLAHELLHTRYTKKVKYRI